jgi:hypothetical protein
MSAVREQLGRRAIRRASSQPVATTQHRPPVPSYPETLVRERDYYLDTWPFLMSNCASNHDLALASMRSLAQRRSLRHLHEYNLNHHD